LLLVMSLLSQPKMALDDSALLKVLLTAYHHANKLLSVIAIST